MMSVSVVIPTRNRFESLCRCLTSLERQTYPLKEVLIVDASDAPVDGTILTDRFSRLRPTIVHSQASVCAQRNRGIKMATGTHVLLSDDDIEYPSDYVANLLRFIDDHPDCGAVSGVLLELSGRGYDDATAQTLNLVQLCWKFLFQLTVWADVESTQASLLGRLPLKLLMSHYRRRLNTFTLAGWPLVTQVAGDDFRTAIFGLGASVVRREWLLASPYDEILDSFGIGDNYGVAIGFPGTMPIAVVRTTSATHHRSEENRLTATVTYFRRVLALDYFMVRSKKFTPVNRAFLCWSLLGNFLAQMIGRDFHRARATLKALLLIAVGRNPYLKAVRSNTIRSVAPIP